MRERCAACEQRPAALCCSGSSVPSTICSDELRILLSPYYTSYARNCIYTHIAFGDGWGFTAVPTITCFRRVRRPSRHVAWPPPCECRDSQRIAQNIVEEKDCVPSFLVILLPHRTVTSTPSALPRNLRFTRPRVSKHSLLCLQRESCAFSQPYGPVQLRACPTAGALPPPAILLHWPAGDGHQKHSAATGRPGRHNKRSFALSAQICLFSTDHRHPLQRYLIEALLQWGIRARAEKARPPCPPFLSDVLLHRQTRRLTEQETGPCPYLALSIYLYIRSRHAVHACV